MLLKGLKYLVIFVNTLIIKKLPVEGIQLWFIGKLRSGAIQEKKG